VVSCTVEEAADVWHRSGASCLRSTCFSNLADLPVPSASRQ
jgi:hypothetical protein